VSDAFGQEVLALVGYYLAKGCPCRFPRFRAVVSRDTSGVAGGAFRSDEQMMLIWAFEQKLPLVDRRALEGWGGPMSEHVYEAECGVCGSRVERSSNEFATGAWVEYLVIRRARGLVDLGASVEHGLVFRPRPFVPMGPGMTGMNKAAQAYPFMEEEPWLEWMRALKDKEEMRAS
jgi:hypothetical protein